MNRPTATTIYVLLLATTVALDLWSKQAVFDSLGAEIRYDAVEQQPYLIPCHELPIITNIFSLQAVLNRGAFSGWFSGQRWLLLGVSLLWVAGTFIFILSRKQHASWLVFALALTAGGALGNLYDRYFFGAVRDFLKFYVLIGGKERVWPNFNVADSCICCGVGLILLREFFHSRELKRSQKLQNCESATSCPTGVPEPQTTTTATNQDSKMPE